jgi:hypothetical protein
MANEVAFHWCERMVSSHWSVEDEGASYWSIDSCFSLIRKKKLGFRKWTILSLDIEIVLYMWRIFLLKVEVKSKEM